MQPQTVEFLKSVVIICGTIGSVVVFSSGVSTYLRTEKWKRAEFLANEMKEFFTNPRVQKTLFLIDWGSRELPLIEDRPPAESHVLVTRSMQTMALRPHIILDPTGSDPELFSASDGVSEKGFTQSEAAIRDCYDAFRWPREICKLCSNRVVFLGGPETK